MTMNNPAASLSHGTLPKGRPMGQSSICELGHLGHAGQMGQITADKLDSQ
jgi:hypothetical protein